MEELKKEFEVLLAKFIEFQSKVEEAEEVGGDIDEDGEGLCAEEEEKNRDF